MTTRTFAVAILAGIMIGSGLALAKGPGDHPGAGAARAALFEKHGGMWVLHNDNITIWFHQARNGEAKPQLRVLQTGADGNKTGYSLDIKRVLEVSMPNGTSDANASDLHVVHWINLARMQDWNVQKSTAGNITTLTMTHAEQQGIITLAFHIDDKSPSVKFDVDVQNWAWGANATDHHLILDLVAHSAAFTKGAHDGSDRLSLGNGFIQWNGNATEDGATVPVTHTVRASDCDRAQTVDAKDKNGTEDRDPGENCATDGRLALVFGGTGGYKSLAYDPTLGVESASTGSPTSGATGGAVPFAGSVAVVGLLAAVAIVARRKA
ncbi:MAG: hypothetical protein ACYDCK_10660 [Thermoplasmatota archaeon]